MLAWATMIVQVNICELLADRQLYHLQLISSAYYHAESCCTGIKWNNHVLI